MLRVMILSGALITTSDNYKWDERPTEKGVEEVIDANSRPRERPPKNCCAGAAKVSIRKITSSRDVSTGNGIVIISDLS